jgi:hypothetical protein
VTDAETGKITLPWYRYLTQTTAEAAPGFGINVKQAPYNAVGDGVADDTDALQAAIDAAIAAGDFLFIPAGQYNYTAPLTISGNLSIMGAWVANNWGTGIDGVGINVPLGTPVVVGSVLYPTSNGSNAITITGGATCVHIRNLGISFQTPLVGTGHAIYYVPVADTQGLSGSIWENVTVWGHDGNHYAFKLTNPIYSTFINCYGFGGGLFSLAGNSNNNWHYGNSVFINAYGQTILGGTANGIDLAANTGATLNLLTWIRPQIILNNDAAFTPPLNPPTNAQYMWRMDADVVWTTLIAPDLETNVSGATNVWSVGSNGTNVIIGSVLAEDLGGFSGLTVAATPSVSVATLSANTQDGLTVANGANAIFCPGGAAMFLLMHNTDTGGTAIALVDGGTVSDIGVSSPEFEFNTLTPAGGNTSLSFDGATDYRVYNNTGASATYKSIVLRPA